MFPSISKTISVYQMGRNMCHGYLPAAYMQHEPFFFFFFCFLLFEFFCLSFVNSSSILLILLLFTVRESFNERWALSKWVYGRRWWYEDKRGSVWKCLVHMWYHSGSSNCRASPKTPYVTNGFWDLVRFKGAIEPFIHLLSASGIWTNQCQKPLKELVKCHIEEVSLISLIP